MHICKYTSVYIYIYMYMHIYVHMGYDVTTDEPDSEGSYKTASVGAGGHSAGAAPEHSIVWSNIRAYNLIYIVRRNIIRQKKHN